MDAPPEILARGCFLLEDFGARAALALSQIMPPTLAANNMPSPTLCTIIAKNFLPYARCLTDSFLTHHPDGRVFLLLIDEIEGCSAHFLRWWQQHLLKYCVIDLSRNLFVDQRWIDLVPGLFSGVVILRDAGYNAAHWNISYRRLHRIGDQWHANDVPLVFFHFSSLQPENISVISTHQNRYTLSDLPALRPLFEQYHDALFSNGYATACHWRYTYSRFDNGVPVADDMRYIWRDHDGESRWHQPFNTQGDDSFFNWLNAPAYHVTQTQPLITHLALEMCRRRPDWRDAFPAPLNFSRQAFARHFVREMIRQSILDPAFVTPMRESLESFLQTPFAMLRRRFYDLIRSVLRLKTFKVFKTLKVSSDKSHRD
ncbi:MAG: hypothetical protein HZB17_06500 [Chloroflexi bacterium]|nr:hypothetical protein [Chloroflexota bacterium]